MSESPILLPIVTLVGWSMIMLLWTGYVRFDAFAKTKFKHSRYIPHDEQMNKLPPEVRWKGDNYNHLMEQPTVFYAIAIVLAITGHGDGMSLVLAWTYVGLRIAHSLVQATVNIILWRFSLFLASSIVLIAMVVICAINLLHTSL